MGVSVTCDDCKRPLTAGPVICSQCAVDNAREYAATTRAEERATIVAWLLGWADDRTPGRTADYELALRDAAEGIADGDHAPDERGTDGQ